MVLYVKEYHKHTTMSQAAPCDVEIAELFRQCKLHVHASESQGNAERQDVKEYKSMHQSSNTHGSFLYRLLA